MRMAKPTASLLLAATLATANAQDNARPMTWTEASGANNPDAIGLGYPVPTPEDLALPFDGFRSYLSLFARHQDLQLTTPWVHGEVVGETNSEREIWAYRMGDADGLTVEGLPEPAMMTQGGIHAREWQSPEVVTGVMELLAESADDNHLYRYLLDNANVVLVPVLNVDGFMQTQRFPEQSYLGSDANSPEGAPRDGRMRRKNMLSVDEVFTTSQDHLQGVDLNRNNPPWWATNPQRSSSSVNSLVHHGVGAHSEPETQAMVAASTLGPQDRLRMYTDVHSFSQVYFSSYTENARRNAIQDQLLADLRSHYEGFPANKTYFDVRDNDPSGGIGATDEYFAHTFQIPSWTLEIEPSGGSHPNLPGCGADYGGFAENCHDGFVLPESEIRRVREELAQNFAIGYYHQAGPPSLIQARVIDQATGAVVLDYEWDVINEGQRELAKNVFQPLQSERDYSLWLAFDKPMRWRDDNANVVPLPGQPSSQVNVAIEHNGPNGALSSGSGAAIWQAAKDSVTGYRRYQDDALLRPLRFAASEISAATQATLSVTTQDLVGQSLDADPSSPVDWVDGHWVGYQGTDGSDGDAGGTDQSISYSVSTEDLGNPFVIEAGTTAAWFDADRNGEGFLFEVLSNDRVNVYWFTYDTAGRPRWLIGNGNIEANRVLIESFLEPSSGTPFGPNFDPDEIELQAAGWSEFIFAGCDSGAVSFKRDGQRKLRHQLDRLTNVSGASCGETNAPVAEDSISGSWYQPATNGQGFVVQRLSNDRGVVYWFTYDPDGNPYWISGIGPITENLLQIDEALVFSGPSFGQDYDPDQLQSAVWGSLSLSFDCDEATATYESDQAGFGSGSIPLTRLTQIAGLDCN